VNLFFDLDTSQLVTGAGTRSPLSTLALKRGDNLAIKLVFLSNGQVVELAAGATGVIGIKAAGDYDGDYLAVASSWTKTGTGTSTVYALALDLNTQALADELGIGAAPDKARVAVMFELEFEAAGIRTSSQTVNATVNNDVNRGTEGTPSALPDAVDFLIAQGVLPLSVNTDADKLALTGLAAGQVVIITNEAKRIEQYLGGTITDQANWAVLRNTVQLSVSIPTGSGNNITVNGAGIANSATPTSAGWVNPHAVPMGAQGSTTLTLGEITSKTTGTNVATITTPSTSIPVGTTVQTHALPVALPDRGVVTLSMTYPAA
jgi:hypothetical protein